MFLDSEALRQGFDPMEIPIDRCLNWVYDTYTQNLDESARNRFEIEVWRPNPGEEPTSGPWSEEELSKGFEAFASDFGNM